MTKKQFKNILNNTKVFVGTKSVEIQERLFEMGFAWSGENPQEVQYTDKPFIFIYESGSTITHSDDLNHFYESELTEIKLNVILDTKIEEETFKAKDFVLVRDYDTKPWQLDIFAYVNSDDKYATITGTWHECILFEGNENLLGTV